MVCMRWQWLHYAEHRWMDAAACGIIAKYLLKNVGLLTSLIRQPASLT
jgi:hypothetical protein